MANKKPFPVMKAAIPRSDVTYSLVAEAGTHFNKPEEAFLKTIDCIQQWLSEKAVTSMPDHAAERKSYVAEEGGHRVECVSLLEKGIWAARFSHPDFGMGDEIKPVAGRHWVIDMAVQRVEEKTRFSIRVACSSPPDCAEPFEYIRPGIIRLLADRTGLKQGRPLTREPWIIRDPKELEELEAFLRSEGRRLPVFLITQPDKRKWTHTPTAPNYLINGQWLAGKTIGYAHVVMMPFEVGYDWTRKVGMPWSAFDGAVRVYRPGLSFEDGLPKQHALFYKDKIINYKYDGETGPKAFTAHAAEIVKPFKAHQLIAWQELPFVPRARTMLADLQVKKINDTTSLEEVKSRYEAQVAALRQQLEEAAAEAEQWSDEAQKELEYRKHHEEENSALRSRVQMLSEAVQSKTGAPVDEDIELPDNYEEIPEWVSRELAGRLVLHPRAIRTLKDARYEDPQLVAKSLLLLANEYRSQRMGRIDLQEFEDAKNALHLTCKGSITKEAAGAYGDTYFVRYPVGTMQKRFIKWHLCNGTSREERHCMRIYFFWDEETAQVVVGSLPAHLDNKMT